MTPIFAYGSEDSAQTNKRKTILVLSCNGGFGHNAAAATLNSILGDKYELKVVYPIEDLQIFGVRYGDQIYNRMLQQGWIRSMNMIVKHIAPRLFRSRKRKIEFLIDRYLQEAQPELVISLIPFINYPATEAARKRDIPYLLITTDNDLRNWVHGLQSVSHPNFRITIGSDLPSTREMLKRRNLPDSLIDTIGLPLRPDFHDFKTQEKLSSEYGISSNKAVILIMMGGAGAETAVQYTRELGSLDLNAHFIVIAGKNMRLAKKLKKIPIHPNNSITVMGFTDKVADLMALSDIIITKPGPGTVNEAMTMQVPLLLDTTISPLSWEKANIELVTRYGIGERISGNEKIGAIVQKYLHDEQMRMQIEQAFQQIPPNQFHKKIASIVEDMCRYQSTSFSKVDLIQ